MDELSNLGDVLEALRSRARDAPCGCQDEAGEPAAGAMAWFREAGPALGGGAYTSGARDVRLDFRAFEVDAETVMRASRDFALFADALSAAPERGVELIQAAQSGQLIRAAELMREMGLTEEQLQDEGGGPLWLVVLAVLVGVAIIASPGNVPAPEHSTGDDILRHKQETGTVPVTDKEAEDLGQIKGLFKGR